MDMQEFATKYDLHEEMFKAPVNYFTRVHVILSNLVDSLNKSDEKKTAGVEKAAEVLREDADLVKQVGVIEDAIRDLIFRETEKDDRIAILLFPILGAIKSEVAEVRKVALMDVEIPQDTSDAEDAVDVTEILEEALCAARILEDQPVTVLGMKGLTVTDLPEKIITKAKDGTHSVKVPHGFSVKTLTAKLSDDTETPKKGAGRPPQTASWTFNLNGNILPTVPLEVLTSRYFSTYTARILADDFKTAYKNRTMKDFPTAPENGEPIEIRVPAGQVLLTPKVKSN